MIKTSTLSKKVVVVAHDIRSTYNVGALFRTLEGLGAEEFILSGYSPYPEASSDRRLPHEIKSLSVAIHKTALGAEKLLKWQYTSDPKNHINGLKSRGYRVIALEQTKDAKDINKYKFPPKVVLVIGNEIEGINASLLNLADDVIEIPMKGKKESFNVVVAAAIAISYI